MRSYGDLTTALLEFSVTCKTLDFDSSYMLIWNYVVFYRQKLYLKHRNESCVNTTGLKIK